MAATKTNIEWFHNSALPLAVRLTDSAGDPVSAPGDYTVTMVIATTPGGDALGGDRFAFTLADAPTARFVRTLSVADLASVTEGVPHYYNIWAGVDPDPEEVVAYGRLTLLASIALPAA